MEVTDQELYQMIEAIWTSVLGLQIVPVARCEADLGESFLTSSIDITGSWSGTLTIECPTELVRQAAGLMFEMPPGETSEDELFDTLGELTNMLGGNLKSLLPGVSKLSLPSVRVRTSTPKEEGAGVHVLKELSFECIGEPIFLSVTQSEGG